jgi:RNA polymerase-binding transcription factor DksA
VNRGCIRRVAGNTHEHSALQAAPSRPRKTLSARIGQEADQGRGEFIDSAHDVGDASVADEMASEEFTEAEHNSDALQQVRDALGRVADGTFGACIVDGGPIEEQRLEAMPWTPYCLKHAQRLEAASVVENADALTAATRLNSATDVTDKIRS